MDKRGKSLLIVSLVSILISSLIVLYIMFFVSAGAFNSLINDTTNLVLQEDSKTLINISVQELNSTGPPGAPTNNITNVTIFLYDGFVFINDTDNKQRTSSSAVHNFTNSTASSSGMQYLLWYKTSATDSLVPNNSVKYFWFNVTAQYPGTYNITVNVTYVGGKQNVTNLTVTVLDITNPRVDVGLWNGTKYELNNTYYNTTTTLNFTCNMSDDGGVQNVSLEIVGQPGPRYTNFTTIPGVRYNQTNFTMLINQPGTYMARCYAYDNASRMNYSTQNFTFVVNAFSFSGWVKNSTFNSVSGANVSIYEFVQSQQGPPSQRIIKSTTTTTNGQFNLTDVQNNGSMATIYKMKVSLNNSDGLVTEIGPNLPQFPREPLVFSMNGGTFYLQNATTFQLYAYNNISNAGPPTVTANVKAIKFGYEVIDQALGYPIESNVQGGYYTANVTVPASRNYTIMFVRDPASFQHVGGMELCQGPGYMNETDCPSPPSSISVTSDNIINLQNSSEINSTNYTSPTALLITVNKSLAFSSYNLTGCLNIVGNTTDVNVSDIIAKMIPWEGFVPPMKGEVSDFDSSKSSSLEYGMSGDGLNAQRGCSLGAFNLTIMGSAGGGIKWLIEAYASNSTTGEYFAAFQNFTQPGISTEKVFNLTLVRLLGTYSAGGDVNTSKIQINITDYNGTAPQQAHVEVYVKNPVFGTMHYIVESLTNGKFNFTLLNNTQEAKVMVFSNQYAPKEVKINLNTNRTDVTLYSFRSQKILDDGSVASDRITGNGLAMKFMRYTSGCNVYTPNLTSDCQIGSDNTADFNPLTAMMAGKSNLWMKTSSNITLYFINVDMMTSGPPDAMMNDNASSASGSATSASVEQIWKFGSMAPDVYDEVKIGIPYNSSVNEDLNYTINFSLLYDNDWNVIWNATVNTTAELPSDYSDFNTTWFGTPGMPCTNASATATSCYLNKTNDNETGASGYFWFTIPHFSSTATKIKGSTVTVAATTTTTTGGVGGAVGTTYDAGTLATAVSKELSVGDKISFSIENKTHRLSLLGMTASNAVIQVTAIRITLTKNFKVGESQLIDVTEDGKNDIEVTLKSLNLTTSKAVFEVRSLAVAAPSAPVTPQENVTAAVCGNGIVETGENCVSCPADVKCAADEECKNAVCTKKTALVEKKPVMKWILIASIIIIAIIVLVLIIRVVKKK